MFFNCGPNPLLLESTYSQALPLGLTSITVQGRSLVQEDRAIAKMSSFFIEQVFKSCQR